MESIYSWFGGRKFFFGLLLFIIATLLFLFSDKTDFDGWSQLVMWIFGIYAVGNVGEHLFLGRLPSLPLSLSTLSFLRAEARPYAAPKPRSPLAKRLLGRI